MSNKLFFLILIGMLAGQNLIGIPAISGTPLSMTRSVTSPTTNGHTYGLNSIAGESALKLSSCVGYSYCHHYFIFIQSSVLLCGL